MPNYCLVPHCKSLSFKGGLKMFHMLPKDENKAQEWLKLIGYSGNKLKKSKSSLRLCSDHFHPSSYKTMRILRHDALPSLHLNLTAADEPQPSSSSTQVDSTGITDWTSGDTTHALGFSETEVCEFNPTTHVKEEDSEDLLLVPKTESTEFELTDSVAKFESAAHSDDVAESEDIADIKTTTQEEITSNDHELQTQVPVPEQLATDNDQSNLIQIDVNTIQQELKMRSVIDTKITTSDVKTFLEEPISEEQFLLCCTQKLGQKSLDFIKFQMLLKSKDKERRLLKSKQFLLGLYYQNPRAYGFLKQLITLPSVKKLRKTRVPVNAGGNISPQCLEHLKTMIDFMSEQDKACVLGLGTTAIRSHLYYDITNDDIHGLHLVDHSQLPKPAKFVCFCVAKGLTSEWQIPIAYTLFNEKDVYAFAEWLDTLILTLTCRGLKVRAIVAAQENDFKYEAQLKSIPCPKNFFVSNCRKIYRIFDVRHLVRHLRDSFMNSEFRIGNDHAKWSFIEEFYKAHCEFQTPLDPNLTEAHLYPDETQKKCNRYAEELFSRSVATTMKMFIKLTLLKRKAMATVRLIETVNDLIDLLSARNAKDNSVMKNACANEEQQLQFLDGLLTYFRNVRRPNVTGDFFNPLENIVVTLKSLKKLWAGTNVCPRAKITMSRSLNVGFVEAFDQEMRQASREKRNADNIDFTSIGFNKTFSKCFVTYLLKNAKLNSSNNFTGSCCKLREYLIRNDFDKATTNKKGLFVGCSDYRRKLPETNELRFVAGYLMCKALDNHQCAGLLRYVEPAASGTSQHYMTYQYARRGTLVTKTLQLPSEYLAFVQQLDRIFLSVFETKGKLPKPLGAEILKAMISVILLPCSCFPLFLVKKLFVRLRIYHSLKDMNRRFRLRKTDVLKLKEWTL